MYFSGKEGSDKCSNIEGLANRKIQADSTVLSR